MPNFAGITQKYRESDEYKSFMSYINSAYPTLPLFLCEQAIAMHLEEPLAYKQYYKNQKKNKNNNMGNLGSPNPPPINIKGKGEENRRFASDNRVIKDAVKIYEDESFLPKLELIPNYYVPVE
jgi:hypothetical protein